MPVGSETTYGQTVGKKLDFEDMIGLLSPSDVPLQGTYNGTPEPTGGRLSALSVGEATETEVDWSDDTLPTPRSTLNGAITNVATSVVVATGDGIKFQEGHVIRIDTEYIRVSSVATDTLTVVRAYASSTGAAHSNAAVVVGVGTTLPEGGDPKDFRFVDRTKRKNLTQIFGPYKIEISETQQKVLKYGVASEWDYQAAKWLKVMAVEFEQALLYGKQFDDTTNKARMMGGLVDFITANVDSTTTDMIESKLIDRLQAVYDEGGVADLGILNGTQKRKLSGLGSPQIRYDRPDRVRGQVVMVYESDFGTLDILLDRHAQTADFFIVTKDNLEIAVLRSLVAVPLARTGDAIKGQMVCEKTLRFRLHKHHAAFSALAA